MTFVLNSSRPLSLGRTLQRNVLSTRTIHAESLVAESMDVANGTLHVLDESVDVATISKVNFIGAGVSVSENPVGTALVTVSLPAPTLAQVLTSGSSASNSSLSNIASLRFTVAGYTGPSAINILPDAGVFDEGAGVSIGTDGYTYSEDSVSIGHMSYGSSNYTVSIGSAAVSGANSAVAVGSYSNSGGTSSVALGSQANVSTARLYGVAAGYNVDCLSSESVCIGRDSSVAATVATKSVAIGESSQCAQVESVALGYNAECGTPGRGVALGYNTLASASSAMCVGNSAQATFGLACAIGNGAIASSDWYPSSVGTGAIAAAREALAIGYTANCQSKYGICIGSGSNCGQDNTSLRSIVIGKDADSVNFTDSTVIGSLATATASNQLTINLSNSATPTLQTTFSRNASVPAAGGVPIPDAVTFWQVTFGATSYKIPLLNA
jgi:trimeric autotransporter adhesin